MRNGNSGKKAQLKILESIAVLIIFFFLVGIGLKFYGNIQLQSLQQAKDDFSSNDATKISQKIAHLPELRCSLENTDQGSCIDLAQAQAWAAMQADCSDTIIHAGSLGAPDAQSLCNERLTQYFEQFGVAEVVLKRFYSADPTTAAITDPNNPANVWVLYNYSQTGETAPTFTQIPVVIYNSLTQSNDFGVLQVRVYQ